MNPHLKHYLDKIQSENGRINAVLDVIDVDDVPAFGPLAGRVFGVKANIAIRGEIWHAGIQAYAEQRASKDARVVSRLRKAGAAVLCNLNMEEGALGAQTDNPWFGKTHNPIKYGYTPGGSSGGSAAAVAAGFVDIALGTDTMGSVRVPSSYCGLWGYKPSHDDAMLDGVMPLSPSLDTVGAHGNSLDDVVLATEIICGKSFNNGKSGDIAVLDWRDEVECEAEVEACFHQFVSDHGLTQTTRLDPYKFGQSRMAGLIISEFEGLGIHEHHMEMKPDEFSDHFSGMLKWAGRQSEEKIQKAFDHKAELEAHSFADFILMPTTPQTAFKFGEAVPANQADFTAFANLSDRPAICFPIGHTENSLPISAQIVGPRGREADLVATVRKLMIAG